MFPIIYIRICIKSNLLKCTNNALNSDNKKIVSSFSNNNWLRVKAFIPIRWYYRNKRRKLKWDFQPDWFRELSSVRLWKWSPDFPLPSQGAVQKVQRKSKKKKIFNWNKKRIADCLWKFNRAMKRKADFVTQQAITSKKKTWASGWKVMESEERRKNSMQLRLFFSSWKTVTRVVNQKSCWMFFFIIMFLADRKLNVTHLCPTKLKNLFSGFIVASHEKRKCWYRFSGRCIINWIQQRRSNTIRSTFKNRKLQDRHKTIRGRQEISISCNLKI